MKQTKWSNSRSQWAVGAAALAGWCMVGAPALANTGVSDERVSLSDGPGSLGGIGENADVSANLGSMSYSVPLEAPAGFAGATPSLALTYSSTAGNQELGIGWDLMVPSIERFTLRGVPEYDSDDVFAANGSDELVRVGASDGAFTYRARFEGGFVRTTWHADPAGTGGYFEAEYPDGSRGFFGADERGQTVESARLSRDGKVFRYMLVATLDRFGHAVRYDYDKLGGDVPLLTEVRYVFTQGPPRYRMQFEYEPRADAIARADMGFEAVLDRRLARVNVVSETTRIRSYALSYEETNTGISRLVGVQQRGVGDAQFPIAFSFQYTQSLAVGCTDCTRPVLVDMGSLEAGSGGGVDLQNGQATLIDINGDSLPDVLDTGRTGEHRFFLNTLSADDGTQRFAPGVVSARAGSGFQLSEPGVQVVDVDGDGFTDMIHTVANRVLCNRGEGDWSAASDCAGSVSIGDLSPDEAGDADPLRVRFLDYDGDRRIDLIRTPSPDVTMVIRNTPDGFVEQIVAPIGAEFDASPLQLGDVNGDSLLDPVQITNSGVVTHRINLGYGQWSEWREQALEGATSQELEEADLQDLNGDGLDDIVVVQGNTVKIALNRAGRFLPFATLTTDDVDGGLPTRTDSTTVLFADMNGSGTTDVVWITSDGGVHFVELYAIRPNLLTQVTNGIGAVQRVEYGTSAREQARDEQSGVPWRYRLPQAMNLVTAMESYATLTPHLVTRRELRYHHGLYDGREKRYRGFEQVEQHDLADTARDSQEAALAIIDFDVGGGQRPQRAGLPLRQQVWGGPDGSRYAVHQQLHVYEDCPLADVPSDGLRMPVRFPCEVASETVLQEGRPESEWVTLRKTQRYDGYGNVTLAVNHGVVGMGERGDGQCGACTAPDGTRSGACGALCVGDEAYNETEYIEPGAATGGMWLLGQPSRSIGYGREGGAYTETLLYYDGQAFAGLQRGQLTRGLPTRVCQRATAGAADDCEGDGWLISERAAYDEHGNPVEMLDALGAAGDTTGHRTRTEYDAYQLKPAAVERFLSGADGPYRLRKEIAYDPLFDKPTSTTRWMLVGAPQSSDPAPIYTTYDAFGRRSAVIRPGDTVDRPTLALSYAFGTDVSEVTVRSRSQSGQPFDQEQRLCFDGFGRTVQKRTLIGAGRYHVSGATELNSRGMAVRAYQGYESSSSACEHTVPADVRYTSFRYDALGRQVRAELPDDDLYGTASVIRTAYAPLRAIETDPEDNDPQSPAHGTPHITRMNGLNQRVSVERVLRQGGLPGDSARFTLLYDELGRVVGHIDPTGNRRSHAVDLLGRALRIDDPSAGTLEFAYDAAGNVVARTDARGETIAMTYDGMNRLVATFDPRDEEATRVERAYDYATDCSECTHAEGKQVSARYPLGAERGYGRDEFGFDVLDQGVFTARTLEGHRFAIHTAHDNAGRITATTYPDGTVLSNRYDAASRLVGIDGFLDELAYDARGQLRTVRYANGTQVEHEYDSLQRVATLRMVGADASTVLQGFDYHRDRVGNLLAVRDTSTNRAGRLEWNTTFDNDAWYRAKAITLGDDDETLAYDYDLGDNVTTHTSSRGNRSAAHVGDYRYDPDRPHAVLQAGTVAYEYDAAGRLIQRGQTALSYDYQGRLAQAVGDGTRSGSYIYGAGVDRVMEIHDGSVTYYLGGHFEVRDGIAVTYVRSQHERVARHRHDGLQTALLDDVAPAGKPDDRIDVGDAWLVNTGDGDPTRHLYASARRLLHENTPAIAFLYGDHLGSATLATGPDGEVLGERAFFPTGATRAHHGYVDTYGFTGQRQDPTTGLVHFRFRELDAQAGRWTSPDPLFLSSRGACLARPFECANGYQYVLNNPANLMDPHGTTIRLRGTEAQRKALLKTMQKLTRDKVSMNAHGEVSYKRGGVTGHLDHGTRLVRRLVEQAHTARVEVQHGRNETQSTTAGWRTTHTGPAGPGSDSTVLLDNRDGADHVYTADANGNAEATDDPAHIVMAHELIHALAYAGGVAIPNTQRAPRNYTDANGANATETHGLEEYSTVGLTDSLGATAMWQRDGIPSENDIRAEQGEPRRVAYTAAP